MQAETAYAHTPKDLLMKIDNSAKTIGPVPGPSGSRASGPRPAATSVKAGSSAGGQPAAVVSATLNSVGGAEPAFNAQKVAEIRQAISEGRFRIDPERIADGLINSVREMLTQRNGQGTER
jgi:negative regulator of flagellin synthesis FlgM